MIPDTKVRAIVGDCKPRASGDDPLAALLAIGAGA